MATVGISTVTLSKDEKTALLRFIKSLVAENKVISNTFTFSIPPTADDLVWIKKEMTGIGGLFDTYMPTLRFSFTIEGASLTAMISEKMPENNVANVLDDIDSIIHCIDVPPPKIPILNYQLI
jgi:hypothetical protein